MRMRTMRASLAAGCFFVWAVAVSAQTEVGTVVAVSGLTELRRGKSPAWQAAQVGQSVLPGDALRTGESGTAKALFADDSVLELGPSTEIEVMRYTVDAAATEPRSLVALRRGKLRVLLSGFYATARLRYEVETPAAVVRVTTGSDTVTIVDPAEAYTDVFVREGAAEVHGKLAVIGPPLDLTRGQLSRVQHGKLPAPPRQTTVGEAATLAGGMEIVGTGGSEGLDIGHPIVAGRLLRQEDRPEMAAASPVGGAAPYLSPGVPGETLQDRLSPDLRANTQPIPEYQVAPPGEAPSGAVDVDF